MVIIVLNVLLILSSHIQIQIDISRTQICILYTLISYYNIFISEYKIILECSITMFLFIKYDTPDNVMFAESTKCSQCLEVVPDPEAKMIHHIQVI